MIGMKRTLLGALVVAALAACVLWSGPIWSEESGATPALRDVSIMAKVLEARLREELGGDVVGGSVFQPGGVRGFRVPGVGVVFQVNVNFPVAEIKSPEKPAEPAKSEDLWDRIERGGGGFGGGGFGSGGGLGGGGFGGGGYGDSGSYFYYQSREPGEAGEVFVAPAAPPGPPAAPVPPRRAASPARPVTAAISAPAAPEAPAPPHAVAPPHPSVPHAAPAMPVPVAASSAARGTSSRAPRVTVATPRSGDWKEKTEKMERVILETLAKYGERLKSVAPDENLIVLVSGTGGRVIRTVRTSPASEPAAREHLAELDQVLATMKTEVDEAGAQVEKAGDEMKAANRETLEHLQAAKEEAGAKAGEIAKEKIQRAQEKVRAIQQERMTAAQRQMEQAQQQVQEVERRIGDQQEYYKRRPAEISRNTRLGPVAQAYSVAISPGGPAGATSWVLKVKKSDLTDDVEKLRKRAEIQSYAGAAGEGQAERSYGVFSTRSDVEF
jgi:hypothetical protein